MYFFSTARLFSFRNSTMSVLTPDSNVLYGARNLLTARLNLWLAQPTSGTAILFAIAWLVLYLSPTMNPTMSSVLL